MFRSIIIVLLIWVSNLYAQNPIGCFPTKMLNVSTGIDANDNLLGFGLNDPFWKYGTTSTSGVIIKATDVAATWNLNVNARALSPKNETRVTGIYNYKRYFNVCDAGEVKFDGVFRADNKVTRLNIYKVGGTNSIWSFNIAPHNSVNPQCYKDIPFSATFNTTIGEYYIEFEYNNIEIYGGFVLQGKLSSAKDIISNTKNCCCNCSLLAEKPVINGNSCICRAKECSEILNYSTPIPEALKNCAAISWKILPIIPLQNANSSQVSLNCKDLKPNQVYTISLTIKCNEKTVTNTKTLTSCEMLSSAFTTTLSTNSLKTQASVSMGIHSWLLVKDDNNDCERSASETVVSGTSPIAQFNNLIPNQSYILYHTVSNSCNKFCPCRSSRKLCFKWTAPPAMKAKSSPNLLEKIKEEEISDSQLPAELLKD